MFQSMGHDMRIDNDSIRLISHPGHEPKPGDILSAVIVTICSGSSYDHLFASVPQVAGEGTCVAVYAVSPGALKYLTAALLDTPQTCPSNLAEPLRRLVADMRAVDSESVVVNWECCSGCSSQRFEDTSAVMNLVDVLIKKGHMVMFSDFSLKALINDWNENVLGPNPFLKVGEFGTSLELRFSPEVLNACPSAQLQKLGELCNEGQAEVKAMGGTISYTIDWVKADSSRAYSLEVLTVMTKCSGQDVRLAPQHTCQVGGHKGAAGHVLLKYPSGGKLLSSAGHWIELTRLDVSMESLLRVAQASYGEAYAGQIQTSLASCSTAAERNQVVQTYSAQVVQQSAPCTYSAPRSR
jgi:hypothetical protein